ncbi:hypothetical protein C1Y40_00364 [Mycobacterium talmoniae]|uniref:Uncharacterized protein n=1 Tax=Mycobacterium talmoniae TaxID=1858794 RepID=A0A2S8BRZ1_9MYCO|nr:hypothetical protein C1Y40_00364 [Mycobacterium talmoniae]
MARRSSATTRSTPSGRAPNTRCSWATAPSVRTRHTALASVRPQPWVTAGITTAGLNTANAAAITSPGTCPNSEPRLQK